MRVLVGCEFSGRVRDAFLALGHDAWSCDLIPCERGPDRHILGDVRKILENGWDLAIFHPPCTHLALSGARWFKDKQKEQQEAITFAMTLWDASIKRVCLENPKSVLSRYIRGPRQIIQPWMFGEGEVKETWLWLKGVPFLKPTWIVRERVPRVHHTPPGPYRSRSRSRTYQGIADAMAQQWGKS